MKNKFRLLLFALLATLTNSCMKPEDFDLGMLAESTVNYDIALPITQTRLTMENIIDLRGGLFVPDDTSLLHIIYSMQPMKAELLKTVNLGRVPPFSLSIPAMPYVCIKDTMVTLPFSDTMWFNMQGVDAKVKTIHLSSVKLRMKSSNTFIFPLELEMNLNNLQNEAGQAIAFRQQTPGQNRKDTLLSLENMRLQMGESDKPFFVLNGSAKVNIRRQEGDTLIPRTGSFSLSAEFSEMKLDRVDAYLNKNAYHLEGEMPIAGFGLERMTHLGFNDARLIANIKVSGVSAPLRLAKSSVLVHNQKEPASVPLIPDNYDVPYPAIDADPMEKESKVAHSITDLLIDRPSKVSYAIDALLNPDEEQTQLHAIRTGAALAVGLAFDVPLCFSADRYALSDTMEFQMGDLDSNTTLTYLGLKFIVKNAFPIDINLSMHFLDADYNKLFSLFHDDSISGGKIGPAPGYHVVEPTVSRFDDELDVAETALVRKARYLALDIKLGTTDNQTVKIYVDGKKEGYVDVKVGARIKVKQKGLF